MNALSQKIFDEYQIRKTKKQKTRFIEMMQQEIPELQVESGGLMGSRNLIVGNPDTAKILITAHYDTCSKMLFPNFIMPKNIVLSLLYGVGIGLLIGLAVGVASGFIMGLLESRVCPEFIAKYNFLIPLLAVLVFLSLTFNGKPNPHTANDNTSGVILLTELLESRPDHAALVFFDNEENGLIGSAFYKRKHKEAVQNQLVINVDCIGDGANILVVLNKKAKEAYGEAFQSAFAEENGKTVHIADARNTYYPSDQKHFPISAAIAAMKKGPLGLYMNRIHTPKDVICDESNLEFVQNSLQNLLKTQPN